MSAWGQLNGTEFIRCAVTEFDTYGFIPRALRARFAKVVGDVLRRVNLFGLALPDSHKQCVNDEVAINMLVHGPANNAT